MFEHEHPLSLIDLWLKIKHNEEETDEDDVDDDDDDVDYTKQNFRCQCDRCDKEINWFHRYYYKCDQCQYSIHKFCAELPETLQHHSHVCRRCHHHLILNRRGYSWNCNVCKTSHKQHELLYRCPECFFKIDLHCATRYLKTNTIHHPSHLHPLVCVVEEILSKCHACGKKHEGIFYQCATCPILLLHSDCAFLPKNLSIQQTTNDFFSHSHPLTLDYSFVIEDETARDCTKCRVCNRGFDNESLWTYKCDKCRYYAHLDCATARHEPFMSILMSPGMGRLLKNFKEDDYPHIVHLPFPDQTMNLIRHLFSKQIESNTSKTDESKQTHISHQHPLILVDTTKPTSSTLSCHDPMKKVELICNGCVRPIMNSPFYTCVDEDEHHCNFALHEWCTRLPSEIKNHPGHPQHTLVFMPKVPYKPFGVFRCDVCSYHCNGFVYCCIECEYNVDVCCAFTPDKITHKAHPNHLLSRVTKRLLGDWCRLCFWDIDSDSFSFSCQDCGFHIHPECALLVSETIRHKYDKHPLKLSYFPIENHKGDYFCDICEEQFYPEWGCFYHCQKCVQSMHPSCSMPIFPHKNPIPSDYIDCGYDVVHKYVNIKFGGRHNIETHPHPLSFVQGLESDGECAECNNGLEYHMIFKCLGCMGRLLKNFKDDDYPQLVHLPFPDQTMNLIKQLFSSTSETNEVKQTHTSHQHPLILVSSTLSCHNPMKKVELICNGCVRPIMDSPFYKCADEDEHHCNFALHEWCTRLPSEIKNHPGHPQHTLVFMPKVPYEPFGVFRCDVCSYHCNGFVYCCIECEYNVDVCCAFIPDKITHSAHPNHLLSFSIDCGFHGRNCRLCFYSIDSDWFSFSCQDCGFHIHPGCALLVSETIRHKYDKHPLKLSYLPIENHKGDYFCDICEEQFYPEWVGSFYHCEKCVQSMHPSCSMPVFRHKNPIPYSYIYSGFDVVHKYVNIKFGGRHKIETHPHPLSFVQGLESDGECAECNVDLEYEMILKCLGCEFVIHYDCLS